MISRFFTALIADHPSRELAHLPEPLRHEVLAAHEATSVYDLR